MIREIIKIYIGQIVEIREYCSVVEYNMDTITETDQGINITMEVIFTRGNCRGNLQSNQNFRGQNYRGGYRRNYRNDNYEIGRSRSRDRQYSDNTRRNDRSNGGSRSG